MVQVPANHFSRLKNGHYIQERELDIRLKKESNIDAIPYKPLQRGHSAVRSTNTQLNLNFVALVILQTVCVLLLVSLT